MTSSPSNRRFSPRPSDPDAWVRTPDRRRADHKANIYTARLTIDVTPELRGHIKVAAFRRGQTVADMLRDLLARAFSDDAGDAS